MPLDPYECHEHAKRCMELAAETADPNAQEILVSTAHNWERLASKSRTPKKSCWRNISGDNSASVLFVPAVSRLM